MICKNVKELESKLTKMINDALVNDVSEEIRYVMYSHIFYDVYTAYDRYLQSMNSDLVYKRRYSDNGLLLESNIKTDLVGNGMLALYNVTKGNPYYERDGKIQHSKNANKYIAPIIESGKGYDISMPLGARPFIHNTYEEIAEKHIHTFTLKEVLTKQGLEVI